MQKRRGPKGHRGKPPARCHKRWTEKDYEVLRELWGENSINLIASKLRRTPAAVKIKAVQLGLGPHIDGAGEITAARVVSIIYNTKSLQGTTQWKLKIWREHGLPVHRHVVQKNSFTTIRIDEFWNWARKHQDLVSFALMPEGALGAEPKWVRQKRKVDATIKAPRKLPWTQDEDETLRWMLSMHKYSYNELATHFKRTQAAIRRRIYDLHIADRPIRQPPVRWTERETAILKRMVEAGYDRSAISERLGKSEGAVLNRIDFLKEREGGWPPEDIEYLKESWLWRSAKEIAQALHRREDYVRRKARELGLKMVTADDDTVPLDALMQETNNYDLNRSERYRTRREWIEAGLPITGDGENPRVRMSDFWDWAERHRDLLNFRYFLQGHLGPEPKWLAEERRNARLDAKHIRKQRGYTEREDAIIREMVESYKYSVSDIAARLKRTDEAVRRRIIDLGLKARPVERQRRFWTDEENATLLKLRADGMSWEYIGAQLDRSSASVARHYSNLTRKKDDETP